MNCSRSFLTWYFQIHKSFGQCGYNAILLFQSEQFMLDILDKESENMSCFHDICIEAYDA